MKKYIICHQDGHPIWSAQLYNTWEEASKDPIFQNARNNAICYEQMLCIRELDESDTDDKQIIKNYSKPIDTHANECIIRIGRKRGN